MLQSTQSDSSDASIFVPASSSRINQMNVIIGGLKNSIFTTKKNWICLQKYTYEPNASSAFSIFWNGYAPRPSNYNKEVDTS